MMSFIDHRVQSVCRANVGVGQNVSAESFICWKKKTGFRVKL